MGNQEPYEKLPVMRYKSGKGFKKIMDPVVRESSIRIWINGREVVSILALKMELEELAIGFLYNECLIQDPDSIQKIEYNDRLIAMMVETSEEIPDKKIYTVRSITTSCGKGVSYINPLKIEYFEKIGCNMRVKAETILELMKEFSGKSVLFKSTGAVHSAAWSDGEKILRISDDIGRHNCVDKLVGWKLKNPGEASGAKMLLSSGRISSEIICKLLRSGAEILVSHSAPTTGAIQLAEEYGLTIIGFARRGRFNIYTRPERIIE